MARVRRTKNQVIKEKIERLNEKITTYEEKITECNNEKAKLQDELNEIETAIQKAAEKEQLKALISLLKEKNLTVDELSSLIKK